MVSHSSTIKLWMNGAQRFLVIHDRATCLFPDMAFWTKFTLPPASVKTAFAAL